MIYQTGCKIAYTLFIAVDKLAFRQDKGLFVCFDEGKAEEKLRKRIYSFPQVAFPSVYGFSLICLSLL